ncbi:YbfB/YjiJ family MFS transporter [Pigmentiphaga litoralis]|uniref:Putative MFS family arabinose efflux permease n=1 Tax=Pigmentiphaga litoralis TaxID=516702 RepID=A0A7Y9IRR8_9BURK|nr:YbfB/YjiJ family MFS transporter [Pigmentiphaga litoralis]NYE24599.1 putative MFS family arabinose efflux permease [Pigmentiphaga litoralis]NYE81787.1 putative MFS family arabinose efflux permease [Pigmentiphaga litoralis]
MKRDINLVSAGFALTALTYGLGRFAYGLLLPEIRNDLALTVSSAGWIGGSSFAAYCIGVLIAFITLTRLGDRGVAALAGITATVGLILIATASSAWVLGTGIALAGFGTGLTSPPLAAAVSHHIDAQAHSISNGVINAGTAGGIALSGIFVVIVDSSWRTLYTLFAGIGVAVSVWAVLALPSSRHAVAARPFTFKSLGRAGVDGLCASAFLMGAGSTAVWTFGAALLQQRFEFNSQEVAYAWIGLGTAATLGASTGLLTNRFGVAFVHRASLLAMALTLCALAFYGLPTALAFAGMAVFGAAYIVSTGAFLLWGIALYPSRPDIGLGIPFLTMAVGQTVGAPAYGFVWDHAGVTPALLGAASVIALGAFWRPAHRLLAHDT